MQSAQKRDAINTQKFFFRKQVFPPGLEDQFSVLDPKTPPNYRSRPGSPHSNAPSDCQCGCKEKHENIGLNGLIPPTLNGLGKKETRLRNCFPEVEGNIVPPVNEADDDRRRIPVEEESEEMSINEIFCGKGSYPGLLGLVNAYLNSLDVDFKSKRRLRKYLELVRLRADGSLKTTATWMREYIRSHPAYKHDSVVGPEVNYDLLKTIDKIERGERKAHDLLPAHYLGPDDDDEDDFMDNLRYSS